MLCTITEPEFQKFKKLIYDLAGITLSDAKRALIVSRLSKRLHHYKLNSFSEYYHLISDGEHIEERQVLVDLMTTNETYFFREPKHFELLAKVAREYKAAGSTMRVWSAAASTGEEAYSIAMTLAEHLGPSGWDVYGTDISGRVLERASGGLYPLEAAKRIPAHYLNKYCLKGVRSQEGYLLVADAIRRNVRFQQLNLHKAWGGIGMFDVIFLRNVMIYFDTPTKQKLLQRLHAHLNTEGYLFIGHSETLNQISRDFESLLPAVYRK